LIVNLGTPEAAAYGPIRRYLGEFLGDRRVVEACPAYWYPILFGPILTFRPLKTARLYKSIWTEAGSPLKHYTQELTRGIQESFGTEVAIEMAMTYGQPSVGSALEKLLARRPDTLYVLPLYPQYSGSTTGAVFDVLVHQLKQYRHIPALRFINEYHAHPSFITALSQSVREQFDKTGQTHLVISNHGIPVKYVTQGDPYQGQVERTAQLLMEQLGLTADQVSLTYQSRFGPTQWLTPATDDELVKLAQRGIKAVTVVTPSFAVDCLETLEEIAVGSREAFLHAGGERFELVPALNASAAHVTVLRSVLSMHGLQLV
jgi:ferrochelatase